MDFQVESYTGPYINKTNNHLYIAPSIALEEIVAHYTITFQNHETTIPNGAVLNLIPDVSGCFVFKFYDELEIKVWGPTTKVVTVPNDLNTFSCRFFIEFLPGGLHQVLGLHVYDLLDKKVDLQQINEHLYYEIQHAFSTMTTFDEIVLFIDHLLCREIQKYQIPTSILSQIKKTYTLSQRLNSQQISKQLGVSERQFNRYCHKYIGMSYKKFYKIVNVNHLIQEICQKHLLDLTLDYEYFDQAHFNHVFKEICETTPTHYLQNLSDFYNELYKF